MAYESKEQLRHSLESLLQQAHSFTYENVGQKSTQGDWLVDLNAGYEAWAQRVAFAIKRNFEYDSAPLHSLERATQNGPLKFGPDMFGVIMSHYKQALSDALASAVNDVHGELKENAFERRRK